MRGAIPTFIPVRLHSADRVNAVIERGGASCARCGRLFGSIAVYERHRKLVRFGDCHALADEELLKRGFRVCQGVWHSPANRDR